MMTKPGHSRAPSSSNHIPKALCPAREKGPRSFEAER